MQARRRGGRWCKALVIAGSLFVVLAFCGVAWVVYNFNALNKTINEFPGISEHLKRRISRRAVEGLEEDGVKPQSRFLIDFVEEKKKREDEEIFGKEERLIFEEDKKIEPMKALKPPCLTVKYLMGLKTTTVERDWIYYDLLASINCSIRVVSTQDEGDMKVHKDSDRLLIIKSYRYTRRYLLEDYINTARKIGYKSIGLIHLSDERLNDLEGYKEYHLFDFVLRNYYNPLFVDKKKKEETQNEDENESEGKGEKKQRKKEPKVVYFPLGYKNGFGPIPTEKLLPASRRPLSACFLGQHRSALFSLFIKEKLPPLLQKMERRSHLQFSSKGWSSGLNFDDYRQMLLNSALAFVPGGVHEDTYRFAEVFEAGAVPIIEKSMAGQHLYRDVLGDDDPIPAPAVADWSADRGTEIVRELLSNVTLLNTVQARCIQWWQRYKLRLADYTRDLIMADYSHDWLS